MDSINVKVIDQVEIQENGIIRNRHGWIIGRLNEEVEFKFVDGQPHKYKDVEAREII